MINNNNNNHLVRILCAKRIESGEKSVWRSYFAGGSAIMKTYM